MRSTVLPALLLGLAALGATACALDVEPAAGEDAPPDGEAPVERCLPDHHDCVDTPPDGAGDEPIMAPDIAVVDVLLQEPRLVTPDPDAVGGETFPIFLQEAVVDGATLRVSFSGGTAPCFVLASADAVERDDAVVVNVRAATRADTDQASCTTIVEMQQIEIELSRELGDRLLLDGSRVFQGGGEVEY